MSIPFVDLKAQYELLKDEIRARIDNVLEHGKYIMGPEVFELENELTRYSGAKHAITCSSGTDALLMSLMANDVDSRHAIFLPTFTFIATAEPVALLGATPVFVDIEKHSFNIDVGKLADAIKRTKAEGKLVPKAILAVDLFGRPADYDAIEVVARENDMFVIADAAQSFGGDYKGRKVGNICDLTATSFFPAKPLGGYGDGGAVFTSDDDLADKLRSIRIHGKGKEKYDNIRLGLNARLDTLQAAILLPKLRVLADEIRSRAEIADTYTKELAGLADTPDRSRESSSAWAQYSILIDNRDVVKETLIGKGIPTAIYYPRPLHMQGIFKELGYRKGDFPVAEEAAERILSLPIHPYLSDSDQAMIIDTVKKACLD